MICDTCLTAAYDEGSMEDIEGQKEICREFGKDIADHNCESRETDATCACACQEVVKVSKWLVTPYTVVDGVKIQTGTCGGCGAATFGKCTC